MLRESRSAPNSNKVPLTLLLWVTTSVTSDKMASRVTSVLFNVTKQLLCLRAGGVLCSATCACRFCVGAGAETS